MVSSKLSAPSRRTSAARSAVPRLIGVAVNSSTWSAWWVVTRAVRLESLRKLCASSAASTCAPRPPTPHSGRGRGTAPRGTPVCRFSPQPIASSDQVSIAWGGATRVTSPSRIRPVRISRSRTALVSRAPIRVLPDPVASATSTPPQDSNTHRAWAIPARWRGPQPPPTAGVLGEQVRGPVPAQQVGHRPGQGLAPAHLHQQATQHGDEPGSPVGADRPQVLGQLPRSRRTGPARRRGRSGRWPRSGHPGRGC